MYREIALSLALASSLAIPLANTAEAAIADGALGARLGSIQIAPIEDAQFVFGGRNYCWYDDAWQGPGWYWCGYAWRHGYGWGGGYGFHGWRGGHAGGYYGHGGYGHGGYGHGGYGHGGVHVSGGHGGGGHDGGAHVGGAHGGGGHGGGAHVGGGHGGGGHGGGGHKQH